MKNSTRVKFGKISNQLTQVVTVINWSVLILGLFFTIAVIGCDSRLDPVTAVLDDPEQPVEDVSVPPIDVPPIDVPPVDVPPIDVPPIDVPPIDVPPVDVPVLTDNQQFALSLEPGDKVILKNASNHGVHVRDPAGLHLGEANIIGHMFTDATGTIVQGPEWVGDLIWFEVRWDAIGKGRCEINGRNPCIGWTAAVSPNDNRFLDLR